jgi:hypothetical protein
MPTESTLRAIARAALIVVVLLFAQVSRARQTAAAEERSHPRLMTGTAGIDSARKWITTYPWYRSIVEQHRADIDRFIARRPVYVSPLKQTYMYQMYTCPKHGVELLYEEFRPFEHRCAADTNEIYSGGKYDMAWAGWYNRLLGTDLVWMGILYNVYGDQKYAEAGRGILVKFADLYLSYTTDNTILGPAHVFFGTLSESFWGVDMAYGYDLLYTYPGFTPAERKSLKEKLFYPLAAITQKFPETASNRQLWYNNVSAAVGFLYGDRELIDFAISGKYGFRWQLGSALPESGFWPEWSGYHFVALRGMIHLAEMASHNGYDLYHMEVAGRTLKNMFDAPFLLIQPNYEFPRSKDSGGGSILEYAPFYEVGFAVYRDRKYLGLLNQTHLARGTQVVGESSALGKAPEPVSMFDIDPDLPRDTVAIYTEQSTNLAGNGFAILRDSTLRTYLYLDYGILGGEHGHPDRLQMGYYAGGRNWIVDPLNESYMNPNLQLWYRRSIAHNTLVVDQTDQAWTNGYGNFFGALPSFQVASGGSTTEYHGVKLTRTLIQVGDYFLDLFDAESPDVHTYDLPLHSFGDLTLEGLNLERQPVDMFGHKPGIPGYDQLTDIYKCETDSSFAGVFSDRGGHLMVRVIGEPGTQVIKASTPPIGGFYKQSAPDRALFPVLVTRRIGRTIRFATLIHAYEKSPAITSFTSGPELGSYIIRHGNETDIIYADAGNSVYSIVREKDGVPEFAAAYNVKELRAGSQFIFASSVLLESIQCAWNGRTLIVKVNEGTFKYDTSRSRHATGRELYVWTSLVDSVSVNGEMVSSHEQDLISIPWSPVAFLRIEDFSSGRHFDKNPGRGSVLFAGMSNTLSVGVTNAGGDTLRGKLEFAPVDGWRERTQSQSVWWGGIVNLVAVNKYPAERQTSPSQYTVDSTWFHRLERSNLSLSPGEYYGWLDDINAPNNAAPVAYQAELTFGHETLHKSFVVRPPVKTTIRLPNEKKELLSVELTNQTSDSITVSVNFIPDLAWVSPPGFPAHRRTGHPLSSPGRIPDMDVTLKPLETKQIDVPIRLNGYTKENQLYPIRLGLESGKFKSEIIHDFYVGVAHYAKTTPSLDGSWTGWDRTDPMTIDRPSQIGRLLFGNQAWHGPKDLSADVYAMYDRTYLYVGASVTDDSIVSHWDFPRMGYPWDTDCMEIVIDLRDNALQGHDPPTPGTYRHLCLAEYRETDFSSLTWQGPGAPCLLKPNLVPGGETYFHRTKDGYAMIARFPLAGLPGIIAKPGYKIGFDVAINDNDGTSFRKNQHIWAGYTQNQSWWDLGTIGALVFGPDN